MEVLINALSLLANICILVLTCMTFYITVFSNKIRLVSFRHNISRFHGDTVAIYLENTTLHPIAVNSASVIRRMDDGTYRSLVLHPHSDDILVIKPRHIVGIKTKPFTSIHGLDDVDDLLKDAIIRVDSSSKTIFVKPCRKSPLNGVKKYIRTRRILQPLTLMGGGFNGQILSKEVRYAVLIKEDEMASDRRMILLTDDGILSEPICGSNVLDTSRYCSAQSLQSYLQESFNFTPENVLVHDIRER